MNTKNNVFKHSFLPTGNGTNNVKEHARLMFLVDCFSCSVSFSLSFSFLIIEQCRTKTIDLFEASHEIPLSTMKILQ